MRLSILDLQCTPRFINVPESGRFDALLMVVHTEIRGGWKNNQEENPTYSSAYGK